jgi:hypothetical protein
MQLFYQKKIDQLGLNRGVQSMIVNPLVARLGTKVRQV